VHNTIVNKATFMQKCFLTITHISNCRQRYRQILLQRICI